MTKIDPRQPIQRRRTEEEMKQALHNFIMKQAGGSPFPQVDDDDIVIYDVIAELLQARQLIKLTETLTDWFAEQDEATQRKILGTDIAYATWKSGTQLQDFIGIRHEAGYEPSVRQIQKDGQ